MKSASANTDLMPKIAVYSSEKMEELINFVEEDRQRTDEHRRYKVCPLVEHGLPLVVDGVTKIIYT